jgi:hypothetical protein
LGFGCAKAVAAIWFTVTLPLVTSEQKPCQSNPRCWKGGAFTWFHSLLLSPGGRGRRAASGLLPICRLHTWVSKRSLMSLMLNPEFSPSLIRVTVSQTDHTVFFYRQRPAVSTQLRFG